MAERHAKQDAATATDFWEDFGADGRDVLMELELFQRLLEDYGADIRSWPEAERRRAEQFLAVSIDARYAYGEAVELDRLLRSARPVVSDASVQRVLGALAVPSRRGGDRAARVIARGTRQWASTALLAGMAVLGLAVGLIDVGSRRAGPSDLVDMMFDTGLVRGLGW